MSIDFKLVVGYYVPEFTTAAKFASEVAIAGGGDIKGSCDFLYLFNLFSLFTTRAAQTREQIFTHNGSRDAIWRKEISSKQVIFFQILSFGVPFPSKPPKISRHYGNHTNNEKIE